MKNKKWILSLITVLSIGVLTGCQSSTNENTSLLEEIQEKGEIVFATEGTYAPFSYHNENGDLVGYDVEIARAIAEKLGVEAKFVETKWDGIIAGLDAKKYDVIANQVGITDERKEKYLFSSPYTYSYGVVIVKEDVTTITSFDDIKDKKSAQTATSNWATIVQDYGAQIIATEGFNQSVELVLQGRADTTVNDIVTFLDYKKQQPDSKVKVAATSTEVSKTAFLLRKVGGKELQKTIDKALKELQEEGKLKEISIQYFGEDVSIKK